MDWDKYKRYSNFTDTDNIIFCYDGFDEYEPYHKDNIVADVTDSYKELSSERVEG